MIGLLPSMKSPTVIELLGDGGYAVETVVPKSEINILIPALKDAGATDIIELPHLQDRPLMSDPTGAEPSPHPLGPAAMVAGPPAGVGCAAAWPRSTIPRATAP